MRNVYHVVFIDLPTEKMAEMLKLWQELKEVIEKAEGADPVGLFFPRGSGYWLAMVAQYRDYTTWEKVYRSPELTKLRLKGVGLLSRQNDMFFDEVSVKEWE